MGALRQIPMTDPRTFLVVHHSAAPPGSFGLDGFWGEYQKRDEGYNIVLTQDKHLSHIHEQPFINVDGIQVAQEAPDNEISNGTYALNPFSYNVCLNGNFEESFPTDAEIHELIQVLAAECKKFGWMKHDALNRIITHNEAGLKYARERYVTQCPGKHLIARMPEIKSKVASYLPD